MNVDYDRLADKYDARYAFRQLTGVRDALGKLRRGRVLEVGCGTGHWLRPGDIGVDLSHGMLARAPRGFHVNAEAAHLPFRDDTFDFVFAVNAVHHFPDKRSFVAEAARVLRRSGAVAVVGIQPTLLRDSWWVYEYFEGTYERDCQRFPTWGTLGDLFLAVGAQKLSYSVVERVTNSRTGANIFADPFLAKDSGSQLALLTDDEYARGVERIRDTANRDPAVIFRSELTLGMLVAEF